MTAPCFPPAKLSANRAIGNWLAELSKALAQGDAYDEAMSADDELEKLAACVAREIEDAYATGHRVGATAICVGRATIERLAADGQVAFDSGQTLVAADDLFHANPYEGRTNG